MSQSPSRYFLEVVRCGSIRVASARLNVAPSALSRQIQKKLKVYAGPDHPHAAQQPIPFEIKQVAQ